MRIDRIVGKSVADVVHALLAVGLITEHIVDTV